MLKPEAPEGASVVSRGISMAEKKQMLVEAGEDWPACDCHGVPMRWKRRVCLRGGSWHCVPHLRETALEWKKRNVEKVRNDDKRRAAKRKEDPAYLLKKIQYHTLYKAKTQYARATKRAEEMYA